MRTRVRFPQGLKPRRVLFTSARLKSCPDTNHVLASVCVGRTTNDREPTTFLQRLVLDFRSLRSRIGGSGLLARARPKDLFHVDVFRVLTGELRAFGARRAHATFNRRLDRSLLSL